MNKSKVVLGVVAGAAAGALMGVLFAPESGAKLRNRISSKTRGYVDEAKGATTNFVDGVMHSFDSKKEEIGNGGRDHQPLINPSKKNPNYSKP